MKPNFRAMINAIFHIKSPEQKTEELIKALEFAFECGEKSKEKELLKQSSKKDKK